MKIVPYDEYKLEKGKTYRVLRTKEYKGSSKRYQRTLSNLQSLLLEGRPVIVVSPERNLDKNELEQYRRFFCKEAKEQGSNMVYFEGPVKVDQYNIGEGWRGL